MSKKNQDNHIRLGSRASPLARRQSEMVAHYIRHYFPNVTISFHVYTTSGDTLKDVPLHSFGGKGLFCKEVDQACINNEIDVAVHSAKDMSVHCPDGLVLAATLPRESAGDVLISQNNATLDQLPHGALVGTCSLRRHALLKHLRPDLKIGHLRGNVQTRLNKILSGTFDATVLAAAGLRRLGYGEDFGFSLDQEVFIPSAGQGVIALVMKPDSPVVSMVRDVNHVQTWQCFKAEQFVLKLLGASCQMPVGAYARLDGSTLSLKVMMANETLSHTVFADNSGIDFEGVAEKTAHDLRAKLKNT